MVVDGAALLRTYRVADGRSRPIFVDMSNHIDRPHGDDQRSPATCPYGDPLGPGLVIVGWSPCGCQAGRRGHRTYRCRLCLERRRWQTVCYFPEHLGGGHPETRR
jgi:hypothetical protein